MNYLDYIRDVHLMCRICLEKSLKMVSIFKAKERLRSLYSIEVIEDSTYPQEICKTCFDGIDYMPDLKLIYEKSQRILDTYIRLTSTHSTVKLVSQKNKEKSFQDIRNKVQKVKESVLVINSSGTKFNWRCGYCYKDFKKENSFKVHQRSCKKALQSKCEYCGKSFLAPILKRCHVKTKHPELLTNNSTEEKYDCKLCGEKFKTYSARAYHKQTKHNDVENAHKCEICNKTFFIKNSLVQHMESHNKEASLCVCPICGKTFHYTSGLFYHMKIHKNERNYKCKYCDRCFLNMAALKRHTRTHTGERPFPCRICGKAFFSTSELKMHTMRHTGEKPYVCKYCSKAFYSLYDLKMHMSFHRGSYACDFCDKSLLNMEVLKIHMEIKHKGEMLKENEEGEASSVELENMDEPISFEAFEDVSMEHDFNLGFDDP